MSATPVAIVAPTAAASGTSGSRFTAANMKTWEQMTSESNYIFAYDIRIRAE